MHERKSGLVRTFLQARRRVGFRRLAYSSVRLKTLDEQPQRGEDGRERRAVINIVYLPGEGIGSGRADMTPEIGES